MYANESVISTAVTTSPGGYSLLFYSGGSCQYFGFIFVKKRGQFQTVRSHYMKALICGIFL